MDDITAFEKVALIKRKAISHVEYRMRSIIDELRFLE